MPAPSDATVYEVGLKGQFPGLAFNLAIIKQALEGYQGNGFVRTGFVLSNAEKQSTFGIELDTSMSPMRNSTVTANFTYLNPKFDSYTGGSIPTADLSGERPAGIPEFAYSVGANYTHEFSENLTSTFHIDYAYESPVEIAQGLPQYKREVQSLNAALSLGISNGLEFTLWGRNLTNAQYITTIFPAVAQAGSLSGCPSQPRTYGCSIRYRF